MSLPYSHATSGRAARHEITTILRRFGAERIGFMDDFNACTLQLVFTIRDQPVSLTASSRGWSELYLRENPWTSRRQCTEQLWNERAAARGLIAVNSILRDWVKGQVTAIETGLLNFHQAFMPFMLLPDGTPMHERATELLEGPKS